MSRVALSRIGLRGEFWDSETPIRELRESPLMESSEEEEREIQLASMLRGTFYCQNCRFCITTCPNKVEIPSLIRAYMYAEGYGNLIQAEMTVEELPEQCGLKVCQNCASCTASCRYGININDRLRSLLALGFA